MASKAKAMPVMEKTAAIKTRRVKYADCEVDFLGVND